VKQVYRGIITASAIDEEGEDLLGLFPEDAGPIIVLTKEIASSLCYGSFLSVGYYVADKPCAKDAAIRALFVPITSDADDKIEFSHAYSEYTGYLWTTEELVVGGHDLINELKSYVGKFLHLEIEYSARPL
jgi:hypothetical protein